MDKVYICSPYRGDIENNLLKARKYCKYAIDKGYVPIAPHIYFTQFMDDNNSIDREKAFEINKELIKNCSQLWICDNKISSGMQFEIDYATAIGVPCVNKTIIFEEVN